MNKFAIGDVIFLPQDTVLSDKNGNNFIIVDNKPSIGIYLGEKLVLDNRILHKIDRYGEYYYISDSDIENLNFYRDRKDNANQNFKAN